MRSTQKIFHRKPDNNQLKIKKIGINNLIRRFLMNWDKNKII